MTFSHRDTILVKIVYFGSTWQVPTVQDINQSEAIKKIDIPKVWLSKYLFTLEEKEITASNRGYISDRFWYGFSVSGILPENRTNTKTFIYKQSYGQSYVKMVLIGLDCNTHLTVFCAEISYAALILDKHITDSIVLM